MLEVQRQDTWAHTWPVFGYMFTQPTWEMLVPRPACKEEGPRVFSVYRAEARQAERGQDPTGDEHGLEKSYKEQEPGRRYQEFTLLGKGMNKLQVQEGRHGLHRDSKQGSHWKVGWLQLGPGVRHP